MASLSFDPKNKGYRLSFRINARKCSIWLSGLSAAKAEEWKLHVEHLLEVADKEPPSKPTTNWLHGLNATDHEKLAKHGLVVSRKAKSVARVTLWQWCETYIQERVDVKGSTKETYLKARDCLVAHFGKDKLIRDIQADDAKRWRIWLATSGNRRDAKRKSMADETVRRRTGKAKQFFAEALERGLVDENPFRKLPSTTRGNEKRQSFIPGEWIERCIKECPNEQWRTILALARYGGLRCPSELMTLRWSDVNIPEGRMVVHATKTEHHDNGGVRVVPIFPELRPYLEAAHEAADDGTEFVVWQYRGAGVNLRTGFQRIIKRAGLVPWERLFQNLRASRETELMAKFPAKDVASWLGNSVPIAMKHYAMATAESFLAASTDPTCSTICSNSCSIPSGSDSLTKETETRKNPDSLAKSGVMMVPEGFGLMALVGDAGQEQNQDPSGNEKEPSKLVPNFVPSGTITGTMRWSVWSVKDGVLIEKLESKLSAQSAVLFCERFMQAAVNASNLPQER